jgi:hypothetical protein
MLSPVEVSIIMSLDKVNFLLPKAPRLSSHLKNSVFILSVIADWDKKSDTKI